MNRVILSTLLCISVFSLCFWGHFHNESTLNAIAYELEVALYNYENDNPSTDYVKSAIAKWNSSCNILCITLRHDEIDEIENDFVRILELSKLDDSFQFIIECNELVQKINHLIEKERPNIKNIF